jgi:hypothetical protein
MPPPRCHLVATTTTAALAAGTTTPSRLNMPIESVIEHERIWIESLSRGDVSAAEVAFTADRIVHATDAGSYDARTIVESWTFLPVSITLTDLWLSARSRAPRAEETITHAKSLRTS